MSGTYIKNMEMPTTGLYIVSVDNTGGKDKTVMTVERMMGNRDRRMIIGAYELIPVPDHGRLIDADALEDAIELTDWYHQGENKNMVHGANSAAHQAWYKEQDIYAAVDNAPTIIPAEEGEQCI